MEVSQGFKKDFKEKWNREKLKQVNNWFKCETNFTVSYDSNGNPIFNYK